MHDLFHIIPRPPYQPETHCLWIVFIQNNCTFSVTLFCHLTFLWILFNVVFLMTMCSLTNSICQYYRHPCCYTGHLNRFLLTRLVGMQQGYKRTFNNLRWVSYFSRSVIIIIYFPWNVISKKYFSWWNPYLPLNVVCRVMLINRRHRKYQK